MATILTSRSSRIGSSRPIRCANSPQSAYSSLLPNDTLFTQHSPFRHSDVSGESTQRLNDQRARLRYDQRNLDCCVCV